MQTIYLKVQESKGKYGQVLTCTGKYGRIHEYGQESGKEFVKKDTIFKDGKIKECWMENL